jgi:hypothetical protein
MSEAASAGADQSGTRHRHLGQLEDDVATVAHDARADLAPLSRGFVVGAIALPSWTE